jgi:hypothetical protein
MPAESLPLIPSREIVTLRSPTLQMDMLLVLFLRGRIKLSTGILYTIKDPIHRCIYAIAQGSDRTRGKASEEDVKEKEVTYAQDMEFLDHVTHA